MNELRFKRSTDAIFSEIGDDIVALNIERGQCYGMEEVTATVWNLLAKPLSLEQLCAQLMDIYEVEAEVCRAEVSRLLEIFKKEELIEIAD
jgi:hypothetical protein